ncbi:acyl transferase/acyl hydrolase/lysophospholipase [Mycena rosella]|uniref:Acyl transferase/acyl hydrolase/lysophospholipase n=1 Tax=Mycena rosella TaxID=1033263 RepID=A0AAD7GEC9_MYCRO|nr:acyl transferase/acyl hydrolase/lysophospholipase [Mycena rosella]
MSTAGPATTPNLGVRVLSLDGGGVRVLSQLIILESIMYRAQQSLGRDTALSPCEYFELIGGSGMGGAIALMLGRLRMSIADILSVYEKLRPQSKWGGGELFKASKFEDVLRDIFREEMMEDVCADPCKTFVCARNEMNLNAGIPELFRSYNTPEEAASGCMIWEAARATTATPDLFKPVEIDLGGRKQRYAGGCLGHNNPASLVLAEAHTLYPSRSVVLVASIGSGHPETIQIPESRSPGDLAQAMSQIVRDCERTHEDIAHRFQGLPNTYFRFNVQQGMQGLASQDWGKSSEVSAHTGAYLKTQDVKAKLSEAVKVLLNPVIPVIPAYPKVCPAPSVRFTGRQDILRKMAEYFDADIGRRHIFLLHGLGGSGKSQIAFKFVEQSELRSQQTLENDLITLALVKKLNKSFDDSLLWLSHQRKKWLIVFNNVDDTHLNLVRYFPSGSHGNILITSRNRDLRQHADTEYKVDRMEVHEATELLLSTARYEMTEAENEAIAKRLVQRWHKPGHILPPPDALTDIWSFMKAPPSGSSS